MNNYFVLILMIPAMVASAACDSNHGKTAPTYSMTMEDHSRGYAYPDGYYYLYMAAAQDEQVQPLAMFRSLQADSITVSEGWHRPYLTGCSPPGSNRTTTAIHADVLIVRLDAPDDGILRHQFKALNSPQPVACGYRVQHYKLR